MDLKSFCARMELSDDAAHLLKPHWEKIIEKWGRRVPEFVSEGYIKKYLPFLKVPEDEPEILKRTGNIIRTCHADEACSLYMFLLSHAAFELKLQVCPALKSKVWGEDEGMADLIAALSCAPMIAENCRKRNIPAHYATDALQWLGGTVKICKLAHNGIPGHPLPQLYWLKHHIDGELYRIGRLEYLIHRLPEWVPLIFRNDAGVFAVLAPPGMKFDAQGLVTLSEAPCTESFIEEDGDYITGIPCSVEGLARVNETLTVDRREFKAVCTPWDIVPSIHIPGGERMSWEDVLNSMKEAKEFFRTYLTREIPMFVCGSWILNPALEKFLPEGNMARFRKETFNIPMVRWGTKGRDGMSFAFGREDVDPTEISPVNSIQKALQAIFKAEGTLRTGAMFVLCEDLEKLGNMYYRTQVRVL